MNRECSQRKACLQGQSQQILGSQRLYGLLHIAMLQIQNALKLPRLSITCQNVLVSLSDLEVTSEWTTADDVEQEDFLIHENVPESARRILNVTSQTIFTLLAKADKWYMDGTLFCGVAVYYMCPSWSFSCVANWEFSLNLLHLSQSLRELPSMQ